MKFAPPAPCAALASVPHVISGVKQRFGVLAEWKVTGKADKEEGKEEPPEDRLFIFVEKQDKNVLVW